MPRFLPPILVLLSYPLLMGGCIEDFFEGNRGTVQLVITDAPVDDVDRVRLSIDAIALISDDRGTERFDFSSPVVISNLLTLQGGITQQVLSEDEVPNGVYRSVRLYINGGGGDSLVREDGGGEFDLFTPGQSPDLSGPDYIEVNREFRVREGETTRLAIDIDLRRALVKPSGSGHYVILPAARLVDADNVGSVVGTVVTADLGDVSCTNDPAADEGNAVYVFSGSGAAPGDIFLDTAASPLDNINPLAVTPVTQDSAGDYTYKAAFLPPGDYTLALTCQALSDFPLQDDALSFLSVSSVSVSRGGAMTVDF